MQPTIMPPIFSMYNKQWQRERERDGVREKEGEGEALLMEEAGVALRGN